MPRDHKTVRRQFAAQYEDMPLGEVRGKSSSPMSQDSTLTIVMGASLSCEGSTNVLLTAVLRAEWGTDGRTQ